jgi:hypothetical protein
MNIIADTRFTATRWELWVRIYLLTIAVHRNTELL